jgi:hypothetical protein
MLAAAPLVAWDEFMPMEPSSSAASLSVYRAFEDNATWDPTFQFKVGLFSKVDLEYAQPFSVDGAQGIGQPSLGLKIQIPSAYKLAALVAASLPIGSESVVGPDPDTRLDFALVHEFASLGATFNGYVAYRTGIQILSDGNYGELQFYTSPFWTIQGALGAYVGLSYTQPLGGNGTIGLWPGLDYTINDHLGICADLDLDATIGGESVLGINMSIYGSF